MKVRHPELRALLYPVRATWTPKGGFDDYVLRHFADRGVKLSRSGLGAWVRGNAFPSLEGQRTLAEVIGGQIGTRLMRMQTPGRTYRVSPPGKPKKEDGMARPRREYARRMVTNGDGSTVSKFVITCDKCGEEELFARTGRMDADEFFRSKGWETDHNPRHDRCPECVGIRRGRPKLVASNGVTTPEPVTGVTEVTGPASAAEREMTREEGRLIFRAIEAHWDDHKDVNAYRAGWSDVKIAEAEGVPVDWVAKIRERDFGGVGEDPAVAQYVREQVALEQQFGMITAGMQELSASVAVYSREVAAAKQKIEAELGRYRDRHNMLAERVKAHGELAHRLLPPDETKKAAG